MFQNEEDLRSKLLLPYLKNLGFDPSEISLERSFTIRLGRTQKSIQGRSDILCKINGKNLFIIELKNDSLSISQDDIEQGISYAKLLTENIAPFVIITSGKETKIFETISKKELTGTNISEQSSFWQNGCTLSMDEDLQIRYAALKHFISFSGENLKIFCEFQVKDRMGPIIGKSDDLNSKFVEELYLQRYDLNDTYQKFINSGAPVFGLVGEAGVGKTNSMCSLALSSLENNFVFFYNGALLNKSPIEYISQDLNLFFSGKSDNEIVLRKLNELGSFLKKKILIFIDAIDECPDSNMVYELSEIAFSLGKFSNVKICISCKQNSWDRFLKVRDIKNHLYTELLKFHDNMSVVGNNPGFLLSKFNDNELADIVTSYRHSFGFKGLISVSVENELRNGFFLRIFSEVYRQRQIPDKIDDKELIRIYLEQSLEKTQTGVQSGLRMLAQIGQTFIQQKYTEWAEFKDEGVRIDDVLDELHFSFDQSLPEELFSRNILIRSNNDDSYNVSFYYSKIRDYIICYHSFKLDKLDDNEFYNLLETFFQNHIGQSAIYFYLENSKQSHLNSYERFKKDKALSYVKKYDFFLDDKFSKFKAQFDPKTIGQIGILLPEDLINEDGYALIPLDSSVERRIQFESFKDLDTSDLTFNNIFKKGASLIHSTNSPLMVLDQDEIVRKNILKQLKTIIENGKLYEYDSNIILLEKMATIFFYNFKRLKYDIKIDDYYQPRYDLIYPIDLELLNERLYKFRASYYYTNTNNAKQLIDGMVEDAYQNRTVIPGMKVSGDFPPFEELYKIVNILIERGYRIVSNHYLPCPNRDLTEVREMYFKNKSLKLNDIRVLQFDEICIKKYITEFFEYLEIAYKCIVERCFPTFKNKLSFYSNLPHEYVLFVPNVENPIRGFYGRRHSSEGKFSFRFEKMPTFENRKKPSGFGILRGFSFGQIIHIDNPMQTVSEINSRNVDESCVLRNWVYKILKEDFEKYFGENDLKLQFPPL